MWAHKSHNRHGGSGKHRGYSPSSVNLRRSAVISRSFHMPQCRRYRITAGSSNQRLLCNDAEFSQMTACRRQRATMHTEATRSKDDTLSQNVDSNQENALEHELVMSSILDGLDNRQRKVVTHRGHPLLVLAGPGTGKSHVIAARIVHLLLNERVQSEAILALTFTDKAAAMMQERVDVEVPLGQNTSVIRTFHSFAYELLQEFGHYMGLDPSGVKVMSAASSYVFLRQHLHELPLRRYKPQGNDKSIVYLLSEFFGRLQSK